MKRKLLALAMAMIFAAAGVGASDFRFFVDGIDQHPTILIGFLPTYVSGGVGYSGIELLTRDDPSVSVLLMTTDNVSRLRQAYPNYYLDASLFVENIQRICDKFR